MTEKVLTTALTTRRQHAYISRLAIIIIYNVPSQYRSSPFSPSVHHRFLLFFNPCGSFAISWCFRVNIFFNFQYGHYFRDKKHFPT